MALSTQYTQDYQQAVSDYMKGHYEEAAATTDHLVRDYPEDPNLRLLRGHIYSCLQQYEIANQQYKTVLELTHDPELLDCARNSLADSSQCLEAGHPPVEPIYNMTNGVETQRHEAQNVPFSASLQISSDHEARSASEDDMNPFAVKLPSFDDYTSAPLVAHDTDSQLLVADSFADGEDDTLIMHKNHSTPNSENSDPRDSNIFSGLEADNAIQNDLLENKDVPEELFDTAFAGQSGSWDEPFDLAGQHARPSPDADALGVVDQPEFPLSGIDLSEELSMDGFAGQGELDPFDPEADFETDFELDPSLLNLAEDDQDLIGDTGLINVPHNAQAVELDGLNQASDLSVASQSGFLVNDLKGGTLFADGGASPFSKRSSGILAPLTNASLQQKQFILSTTAGVVSAAAVVGVGVGTHSFNTTTGLGAAAAGLAGGIATLTVGQIMMRHIKASTNDLHTQLTAVAQGDWSVRATEFSKDEFGQLATSFNQMTRFIESTTAEVQRKAEEQEKAKEDLQRQVIRLLDDVEGAARGDLTVQAEVTADILGAVADSFNLTITISRKLLSKLK